MAKTLQANQVADAVVTVPGQAITLFSADVLSTQTISSGTFADIPSSALPEQEFYVGVGGTYDLIVLLSSLCSSTIAQQAKVQYQLVIDEAGFNGFSEQIIGADASSVKGWDIFTINNDNTAVEYKTVFSSATLDAGTHKLKIQARTNLNSPRVSSDTSFSVKGILRTGSGAGGTIISSDVLTSNLTLPAGFPGTQTDVTSVSVNVSGPDDSVLVIGYASLRPSSTTSTSSEIHLELFDGATDLDKRVFFKTDMTVGSLSGLVVPLNYVVTGLTAGSHTLTLKAKNWNPTVDWLVIGSATDDVAPMHAIVYRGGQVPIQQNGVTKLDTPRAYNFLGAAVENNGGVADIHLGSTAPGSVKSVVSLVPASNIDLSSTTFTTISNGTDIAQGELVVDADSHYSFMFNVAAVFLSGAPGVISYFQVVIDEGGYNGFTEQTITPPGGEEAWALIAPAVNDWQMATYETEMVSLEAGTHLVSLQYRLRSADSGDIFRLGAGQGVVNVLAKRVSGSGAGGVLGQTSSDSSFTISGTLSPLAATEITSLEQTVVTSGDERISVDVAGSAYAPNSGESNTYLILEIDGVVQAPGGASYTIAEKLNSQFDDRNLSFSLLSDPLSAGSHTIKLYACKFNAGQADWRFSGRMAATQYRGGLVPIRNNGTTIQDTPVATDYGPGFVVTNNAGVAQVEASSNWRYLSATDLPTGAAAPEAVWQFDGTGSQLNDRTGNGHDLTVSGSAIRKTAIEGLVGLSNRGDYALSAALPSGLRTTGGLTAAFLVSIDGYESAETSLFYQCGGAPGSELEADNTTFWCGEESETGRLRAFHEYGAGNNEPTDFDAGLIYGSLSHVVFTRDSAGTTIKVYANGQLLDSNTVSNVSTGGTSNVEAVLMGNSISTPFYGAMLCGLISLEEWSAAQVLESYKYCRKLG